MAEPSPPDLAKLLARLDALEREVARIPALEAELARKDKIIAGLQQRLFGSSSEKLDPAQLQLLFDGIVLGKPAPPPDSSGATSAPEEGKPNAARTRRTKAELFPANLKVVIDRIDIPDEVAATPDDWEERGEEHHDELDVIKAEIFWWRTIRKKFVHKTSRPLADDLHRFVLEQRKVHRPAGDVGQALGYALNQWPKFLRCLEDGALELDTNLVENMIRPTKLGMKNWMFFGSLEAGANNALIYTLLANCRAQDLDPEDYLVEVLKRLPHDATVEQAAALTPARIAAERRSGAEQAA